MAPKRRNTMILMMCIVVVLFMLVSNYYYEISGFVCETLNIGYSSDKCMEVWTGITGMFDDRDIDYKVKTYDGTDYENFDTFGEAIEWIRDNPWECSWVFDTSVHINYVILMVDNDVVLLLEFDTKQTAKRYYDYYLQDAIDGAQLGEGTQLYTMLLDNVVVTTSYGISDFNMTLIRAELIKANYFKNEHAFNQEYIDFMKKTNPEEN